MVQIKLTQIFDDFLIESNNSILKVPSNKILVDAIINRYPITFYYSGPRKPKKKSVKAGTRVKAEAVALGVQKNSGNLILRAYIDSPSVSKRGTPTKVGKVKSNYGWRTFLVSRMSRVNVLKNERFDTIREKYSPGNDRSMSITYVSTDFTQKPPKPVIGSPKKTKSSKEKTKVEPSVIEPKKPLTVKTKAKNVDDELRTYDNDLQNIEKEIQQALSDYKINKGTEDEAKYIKVLKDLNLRKNDLINQIANTIDNIGSDLTQDDKLKVKDFNRVVSDKKKKLDIIVPTPSSKPSKLPEPEKKENAIDNNLPQPNKKEKPDITPPSNVNEEFIYRVKKLILY